MASVNILSVLLLGLVAILSTGARGQLLSVVVEGGEFEMTPTGDGKLRSNSSVTNLIGKTDVDFVFTSQDTTLVCKQLTCTECKNYEGADCVSCLTENRTIVVSDDFISGVCDDVTVSDGDIFVEMAGIGCETSGKYNRTGRELVPDLWNKCTNSRNHMRYLKIGFALTSRIVSEKFQGSLRLAKLAVVATVAEMNLVYEYQLRVRIEIGEIYIANDPDRKSYTGCSVGWNSNCNGGSCLGSKLNSMRSWSECTQETNVASWQLIDVNTNYGGTGIAYIGGVCQFHNMVGVNFYSSGLWKTVAHELGHVLNAEHPEEVVDGETVVMTTDGGIMGYGDGKIGDEYQFDDGNRDALCGTFAKSLGDCEAYDDRESATCGNGIVESGEECECADGTDCSCCENCRLRGDAQCSPHSTWDNCCTDGCMFATMAQSCQSPSGTGYCSAGQCVKAHWFLNQCGLNAASCSVSLKQGNGKCYSTGYLDSVTGENLHQAKDGSVCINRGTCSDGDCVDQDLSPTAYPTTRQPTKSPSRPAVVNSGNEGCGKSEKKCSQLSFTSSSSVSNVCARTKYLIPGSRTQCLSNYNYNDALVICENLGARLCTANEMHNNVAGGTGCNFDSEYVWSSTSCGSNKFYAVTGGGFAQDSHQVCASRSSTQLNNDNPYVVRCCADKDNSC